MTYLDCNQVNTEQLIKRNLLQYKRTNTKYGIIRMGKKYAFGIYRIYGIYNFSYSLSSSLLFNARKYDVVADSFYLILRLHSEWI